MNRIGDSLFCTGANEELVRALTQSAVEFVLNGGLAISWYCSSRVADDMDLLVNPTSENSGRISSALSTLHLNDFNENSFTRLGLQVPLKHIYYAELLTPRKDGPTYSEIAADAADAKIFNIPVRIASVAGLIRLKELAVSVLEREKIKHTKDIELLQKSLTTRE